MKDTKVEIERSGDYGFYCTECHPLRDPEQKVAYINDYLILCPTHSSEFIQELESKIREIENNA